MNVSSLRQRFVQWGFGQKENMLYYSVSPQAQMQPTLRVNGTNQTVSKMHHHGVRHAIAEPIVNKKCQVTGLVAIETYVSVVR